MYFFIFNMFFFYSNPAKILFLMLSQRYSLQITKDADEMGPFHATFKGLIIIRKTLAHQYRILIMRIQEILCLWRDDRYHEAVDNLLQEQTLWVRSIKSSEYHGTDNNIRLVRQCLLATEAVSKLQCFLDHLQRQQCIFAICLGNQRRIGLHRCKPTSTVT